MSGTRSLFAGLSVKAAEEQDPFRPGSYIQAFQIVEELKGGSMGRVFKCRHPQTGAYVVLKTAVTGTFLREDALRSFDTELLNWSALPRSNHIVTCIGAFYDSFTQMPFIILPYITGHPEYGLSLREWMQKYTFSEKEIFYIALSICRGMKDVSVWKRPVHGDIKPENIFLEYRGNDSRKEICLQQVVRLTDCGCNGSTECFLPRGHSAHPTTGTDVYALYKVLEELGEKCSGICGYDALLRIVKNCHEEKGDEASLAELYDLILGVLEEIYHAGEEILPFGYRSRADDILDECDRILIKCGAIKQSGASDLADIEKMEAMREEAHRHGYTVNQEVPLAMVIDRKILAAAEQMKQIDRALETLAVLEEETEHLTEKQKQYFWGTVSVYPEEEIRIKRGILCWKKGDRQTALTLFKTVSLEFCSTFSWITAYHSVCAGQKNEAEALLEKIKTERNRRAIPERQAGDTAEEWNLSYEYARLLSASGSTQEAAAVFEDCYRKWPDNLDFLFSYGESLLMNGYTAKGKLLFIRFYKKYSGMYTSAESAEYRREEHLWFRLAQAAYYLGQYEEALHYENLWHSALHKEGKDIFADYLSQQRRISEEDAQLMERAGSELPLAEGLLAVTNAVVEHWAVVGEKQKAPDWCRKKLYCYGDIVRLYNLNMGLFRMILENGADGLKRFITRFGTMLLAECRDEVKLWCFLAAACADEDPAAAAAHLQKAIEYMPCEYPNYDDPDTPTPECLQKRKEIQNLIEGLHF